LTHTGEEKAAKTGNKKKVAHKWRSHREIDDAEGVEKTVSWRKGVTKEKSRGKDRQYLHPTQVIRRENQNHNQPKKNTKKKKKNQHKTPKKKKKNNKQNPTQRT